MSLATVTAPRCLARRAVPVISRQGDQQRYRSTEAQKKGRYPKVQAIMDEIEQIGLDGGAESRPRREISRDMREEAESSRSSSMSRLLDHALSDTRRNPLSSPPSRPPARPQSDSISKSLNPSWNQRNPATFRDPDAPPRAFKGVHDRRKRAEGNTPAEANTINALLQEMLQSPVFNSPNTRSTLNRPQPGDDFSQSRLSPMLPFSPPPSGRRISPRILERMETEEDFAALEQLDELKEEMGTCRTDVDLLNWAKERVFAPLPADPKSPGPRFAPVYPRILAHLLSHIRRNYTNPHLVLALFQHAKTQSPESYLSGCLAPAYNQVLKTQWESFKDLEAVESGIREMEANGVAWDRETARTVGKVVDEISKDAWAGTGWQEVYGADIHERLARLERRLQADVNDQKRMYDMKVREKANMRLHASRLAARREEYAADREGQGRIGGAEA